MLLLSIVIPAWLYGSWTLQKSRINTKYFLIWMFGKEKKEKRLVCSSILQGYNAAVWKEKQLKNKMVQYIKCGFKFKSNLRIFHRNFVFEVIIEGTIDFSWLELIATYSLFLRVKLSDLLKNADFSPVYKKVLGQLEKKTKHLYLPNKWYE